MLTATPTIVRSRPAMGPLHAAAVAYWPDILADLARTNPNAGPGDHASGHNALSQAFTQRPIPAHRGGYATVVPDLYPIGAASWPGPGVGGSSGRAVARRLLNPA